METTPLNPADAVELSELRRRAYGTTEGISADADAQARLEHLETAARSGGVAADEAPIDPSSISSRKNAGPTETQTIVPPRPGTTIAPPPSRRRRVLLATSAVAVCLGLLAAAWVSRPHPDAVLHVTASEPDSNLRGITFLSVPWFHIDSATLRGYGSFHGVEPWVADNLEGSQCLVAFQRTGNFILEAECVPPGVDAVVDVGPGLLDHTFIEGLYPGDVIRFTLHGDAVEAVLYRFHEVIASGSRSS